MWQLRFIKTNPLNKQSCGIDISRINSKKTPQSSLLRDFEAWPQWKSSGISRLPLSEQKHNAPSTLSSDDFNNLTTQLLL